MTTRNLPVFVSCLVLCACACAAIASDTLALPRYHWQLIDAVDHGNHRIDALLDSSDQPLQLDFSANVISVSHARNGIHARYHMLKEHLVVELMAQTMMACVHPSLQQHESVIKLCFAASRRSFCPETKARCSSRWAPLAVSR